jgi:hypothetical protein
MPLKLTRFFASLRYAQNDKVVEGNWEVMKAAKLLSSPP